MREILSDRRRDTTVATIIIALCIAVAIVAICVAAAVAVYVQSRYPTPPHRICTTTTADGVSTTVCRDQP